MRYNGNQQVAKKIPAPVWRRWFAKISATLALRGQSVSVAVVDEPTMVALNRQYRRKNKVTDVLSFAERDVAAGSGGVPVSDGYLGEVVMCAAQAARQAAAHGRRPLQEMEWLLVHGVLHLLGYDHQRAAERLVMRRLEQQILAARPRR